MKSITQLSHHALFIIISVEERRPVVSELSNQKGIQQKANGWKFYQLSDQIQDMVCQCLLHRNVYVTACDFLHDIQHCAVVFSTSK